MRRSDSAAAIGKGRASQFGTFLYIQCCKSTSGAKDGADFRSAGQFHMQAAPGRDSVDELDGGCTASVRGQQVRNRHPNELE